MRVPRTFILLACGYLQAGEPPDLSRLREAWEGKQREVKTWWEGQTSDARRQIRENAQRMAEDLRRKADQARRDFEDKFPDEARRFAEEARRKSHEVWETKIDPYETVTESIAAKARNPDEWRKVGLMALRGQHRRLACEKAKLIPMWNPYERKVTTLEDVAGQFVGRHESYFRGSAFSDDPVQSAGLILLHDPKFMYRAKMLRSRSGEWHSIEEALALPDLKEVAKELAFRHAAAATGLERGDIEVFERSVSALADGVEIANAMTYGPRVRTIVENLLEQQTDDPTIYRRSTMEVRAAMLQAEVIRHAEAEDTGGKVRTDEARKATEEAKATSGSLLVSVRGEDGPVAAATVIVIGTDTSASGKTDGDGRCRFPNLSAGDYSVKAIMPGRNARDQVAVEAGLTASATLVLD